MFYVGQKVVCVDAKGDRLPSETYPSEGEVYTVRSVFEQAGIRLAEIINEPRQYRDGFNELAFHKRRFRPVVETDISIFTAMLKKYPNRVGETV